MTTEHDFQKAQSALDNWSRMGSFDDGTGAFALRCHYETIRFALRLAQKLLKQEPSEGMKLHAAIEVDPEGCNGITTGDCGTIFTDMLTTAVKEIDNDRTRSQF